MPRCCRRQGFSIYCRCRCGTDIKPEARLWPDVPLLLCSQPEARLWPDVPLPLCSLLAPLKGSRRRPPGLAPGSQSQAGRDRAACGSPANHMLDVTPGVSVLILRCCGLTLLPSLPMLLVSAWAPPPAPCSAPCAAPAAPSAGGHAALPVPA